MRLSSHEDFSSSQTPDYIKKKHTGRWSNVSMDVNIDKSC